MRKGQVLFEIDERPFVAAVDQAVGQLMQAEAQLSRTIRDVKRDTPLAKDKAIAQSPLDAEVHAMLAAKAGVQSAQAALEAAQLNRQFTHVTSLVDSVAWIRRLPFQRRPPKTAARFSEKFQTGFKTRARLQVHFTTKPEG